MRKNLRDFLTKDFHSDFKEDEVIHKLIAHPPLPSNRLDDINNVENFKINSDDSNRNDNDISLKNFDIEYPQSTRISEYIMENYNTIKDKSQSKHIVAAIGPEGRISKANDVL